MCGVVEISSETSEKTTVRLLQSLAYEKNLSTVCDVVKISSKALKETNL